MREGDRRLAGDCWLVVRVPPSRSGLAGRWQAETPNAVQATFALGRRPGAVPNDRIAIVGLAHVSPPSRLGLAGWWRGETPIAVEDTFAL
jgi:hypothetical protein